MTAKQRLRVSLVQADILWENIESNLSRFSRMLDELVGQTDLIVLPEMFATGFSMDSAQIAQPMNGRIGQWLLSEAERCQCAIAAGAAMAEMRDGSTKYFNRLLWTEPGGTQLYYDKRHLFAMAGENQYYSKGCQPVIFNYLGWRIRPFVCYDLRFPVWGRNASADPAGEMNFEYDLALYIANWPAARSLQWATLLRARAIENQCFTIGVNRVGTDAKGYGYTGDSAAVAYQGTDIVCLPASAEHIDTVELDIREQDAYRRRFPFIRDADAFSIEMV